MAILPLQDFNWLSAGQGRGGGDIRQIDAVRVLQALKFIDQDSRPEDVIDELKNQSVMLMEINDANRE